ncbi:DNA mismatch repair protein MutS domain protein [Pyrolobus fumarii 1A]|uniref:DNA-binding protein MutS2 n=1 Tax=Pyrolobus fumarii (strain DSM 11204 / 1A) TaxID=694429 RepID=G0EC95_PYRF1|nr:DNA mismatch repair protein MutS [Pyrolobus fumarii]AEM39465.1 DNA mismatch repair protein MutS domain protein [Pyrolobus fumarii 1A]
MVLFAAGNVGKLSDIPGVGPRIAEKLVEYFGDEEEALQAILSCRISLISEAIGRAAATRLVHGLYRALFGAWPRDVAANDDAWKLFQAAKGVILKKVSSPAGRDVLACFLPMPSTGVKEAKRRLTLVKSLQEAIRELPRESIEALRSALSKLEWPKPVKISRIKRTLIIIGDNVAYEKAKRTLSNLVDIVLVNDADEVDRVAAERGEALVYDPDGVYAGPLPRVLELSVAEVVPEAIVEYFRVNWRVIEAVVDALEALGRWAPDILKIVGLDFDPTRVLNRLREALVFKGGEVAPDIDPEYQRLYTALTNLDRVVDEIELWVNNEVQTRLEKLEVRLSAAQFLRLFRVLREGGVEGVDLPEEIYEVFEEVAEEAEKRVVEKLHLTPDEAEAMRGLVPRTPLFPIELNRDKVEELRRVLRAKLSVKRFEVMQKLASKLVGVKAKLERLVDALALLDVLLAQVELVGDGVAGVPEVSSEYLGVGFVDAIEASLVGKPNVQRISYVVGSTPYKPDDTKGERVVLLTGANSGGKTTLLKTICETALLAQSGLVVLARQAWIGAFDYVHFFSKPSGMVDAGALEATLRILAAIVAGGSGRRLVLVDELEAATEAGAAARIMSVVVEKLCSRDNIVAVIVTHMAREILSNVKKVEGCIRVDGIEARGLDENYNLIVDRNPRYYYLARSTPELVVRRLLYRAKGREEREFYETLLRVLSGA